MIKYTEKDRKDMLRKELKQYIVTFGEMTPEELNEVHRWVKKGNSVHDNPCYLADEDGRVMDYITAIRINDDMCDNPEKYNFIA